MAEAASLSVRLRVEGASEAEGKLKGFGNTIQKNGQNIRRAGMALTAFGAVVTGVSALAVKMGVDFDKGMREVNTLLSLSEGQFTSLKQDVRDLGLEIGVTATDLVPSLYQAISAGVPRENVLEFLSVAAKAAIGGVTDTTTAVDGLTSILNAYGMSADQAGKVADLMFTSVKLGKLNFEELSASLFNVVPVAAATGIGFAEVAAAMAALTAQGVPASVAATQLRAAIQALSAPTVRQSNMMKELGLDFSATRLQQIGLSQAFQEAIAATGGNMAQLRRLIGSVEGLQAVFALGGDQAHIFTGFLEEMENSVGASQASYDEMRKSVSFAMSAMKASIGELALTISDVLLPAIAPMIEKAKEMAQRIADWSKENPGLTKAMIAVTAGVGALALVLGPLLIMLPGIIAFVPILGAAFALLTLPIAAVVVAIGLLVAAWATDFMGLRGPITQVVKFIIDRALLPLKNAIDIIKVVVNLLKGDWAAAWESIRNILQRTVNLIIDNFNMLLRVWGLWFQAIQKAVDAVKGFIPGMGKISDALGSVIGFLKDGIPNWESQTEAIHKATTQNDRWVISAVDVANAVEAQTESISTASVNLGIFGDDSKIAQIAYETLMRSIENGNPHLDRMAAQWEGIKSATDSATISLKAYLAALRGSSGVKDASGRSERGAAVLGAIALADPGGAEAAMNAAILATRNISVKGGDLPHLAHGGIVTGPTLAMLGEGGRKEAVIPLDRAGGFGSQTINVIIQGPVYGLHDLEEQVVQAVTRRARAGGFEGVFARA